MQATCYHTRMFSRPWEDDHRQLLEDIFTNHDRVLDIGGGLRVDSSRNNRGDQNAWLKPHLEQTEYVILDKVADYSPDIVGDIHDLPLPDNSEEAILCFAVLEHVEEPQQAVREIYRVLKPGGVAYLYAPFLFYYHPMPGYYKDYFRFTRDGWEYMTKDFSEVFLQNVRGPLATACNLIPFLSKRTRWIDNLDRWFGKLGSDQTSGYYVYCKK